MTKRIRVEGPSGEGFDLDEETSAMVLKLAERDKVKPIQVLRRLLNLGWDAFVRVN